MTFACEPAPHHPSAVRAPLSLAFPIPPSLNHAVESDTRHRCKRLVIGAPDLAPRSFRLVFGGRAAAVVVTGNDDASATTTQRLQRTTVR